MAEPALFPSDEEPGAFQILEMVADHVGTDLPLPERIELQTLASRECIGKMFYRGEDEYVHIHFSY